jgi:hypothetical protein
VFAIGIVLRSERQECFICSIVFALWAIMFDRWEN